MRHISKLVALFAFACVLQAAEFCALTVVIVDYDGIPVKRTWAELTDQHGAVQVRTLTEGPILQICDFGFGPHTLRVGTNECLPVAVSNLRLVMGAPLRIKVVLNPCGYSRSFRSGCLLYLRISDSQQQPIRDVEIVGRAVPRGKTDRYGRYQALMGSDPDITITKEGYKSESIRVSCAGTEQHDIQVTLKEEAR